MELAFLRAGLAEPSDWRNRGLFRGSRMNPDGMLQNAMERWMGGDEARARIRRYFALIGLLGGAFLTRTMQWVDAEGHPAGAIWLGIYGLAARRSLDDEHRGLVLWPLEHQLVRLREEHSLLPAFVYYGLVDTLRMIVNVYDWRDAQAEHLADVATANLLQRAPLTEALRMAGELAAQDPIGARPVADSEPRRLVPTWLGTRSRVSPARALELVRNAKDAWVRKTVEATAVLLEAAARVDRRRVAEFPSGCFGGLAEEVKGIASALDPSLSGGWAAAPARMLEVPDGPPALLFTFRDHDEVEGYGAEALRRTQMHHYHMRTVERASDGLLPVVPCVCIGMNYLDPKSMHRAVEVFRRCCAVMERATYVLDLLRKAKPRRGGRGTQPRIQVTVNG